MNENVNQKTELMKNTVIIAIGKLSTQILSFLLLPLYTAKLSTAEYGTYDFFVTLSVFLLPIITLLMEESMFRFLIDATNEKDKRKVITQTIVYTILGTVVFSVLSLLLIFILNLLSNGSPSALGGSESVWSSLADFKFGIVFIIFVISNILIGLSNALSRGLGQIKLYSLSNFILGASTILLNIFFVLVVKSGALGLLIANTIANSLTAFYIFYRLHMKQFIHRKSISTKMLGEMIRYSVPLVPNTLSWAVINLSDRLIISSFMGSDANGVYSIANRFPYILNTLYGFFYTAWKESAAKIVKEANKSIYYNSIYKDMKKFLFAVVICLIAAMPFAFPLLIQDAGYNEAYIHIPLLVLSTYFSNLSSFYGGIFSAYKNTKIMGSTTIFAAVLNIVINIVLIKFIGLYAAVLSTFIANVVVYWYRKRALKLYIKLKETRMFGPCLMLTIVLLCYYSNNWIFKVLGLVVAIAYSILINKTFLLGLKNKLFSYTKKSNRT